MSSRGATKKDAIIAATLQLLRRSGLQGASLGRALEASGAPKGSLYHYFPGGKTELVSAALARFSDDFAAFLTTTLASADGFEARLAALLSAMGRGLRKSGYTLGCPVAATLLDLEEDADADAIRTVARAALDRWIDILAGAMPELPADQRRPFAHALLAMIEGALILARAERDVAALERVRETALAAYRQRARG